ncbi:MAG: YciI family protein [Bacteroidales bacterium]|jgi:hypothetical protein|nr:YciI family protein [Bacteroidales bacterium]MCU0408883.1 YciI family protein [Bacteroidales bacterium]
MQFVLIAYDGTDEGAAGRRMKVREEHLAKVSVLKSRGKVLYGGAILDDEGKMTGSVMVYEVADRKELDELHLDEPYITGDVWRKIEIRPFRLAIRG